MHHALDVSRDRVGRFAAVCLMLCAGCGGYQVIEPGASPVTQQVPVGVISEHNAGFNPVGGSIKHVPASQVVEIPERNEAAQYHEVRPGETLSGIARMHQVSLERLLDGNGLDANAALQPGQLIYVPPAR